LPQTFDSSYLVLLVLVNVMVTLSNTATAGSAVSCSAVYYDDNGRAETEHRSYHHMIMLSPHPSCCCCWSQRGVRTLVSGSGIANLSR